MVGDRIHFKVRTADGRFECAARAEWRPLDVSCHLLVVELVRHDGFVITLDAAASACGLTSESLLSPEEMGRLTTCPRCRLLTPHVRGRAQPHSVYGTYCNARAR